MGKVTKRCLFLLFWTIIALTLLLIVFFDCLPVLKTPVVPKYSEIQTYIQPITTTVDEIQTSCQPVRTPVIANHSEIQTTSQPVNNHSLLGDTTNRKWRPPKHAKCSSKEIPREVNMPYWQTFKPDWLLKGHPVDLDEANRPITTGAILPYHHSAPTASPSCPVYFRAYIRDQKPVYHLCDTVEYIIEARDCNDAKLTTGGDYLWAWLKTDDLNATQTADGNITDMGNGEYVARFTLRWKGALTPVIAVIRTREEVHFLREWRDKVPARFCYNGIFIHNKISTTTPCHFTPWMNLTYTSVKINQIRRLCNFTDPATGIPWYCIRPSNDAIPCSALSWEKGDEDREQLFDISDRYIKNSHTTHYIENMVPSLIIVHDDALNVSFSRCDAMKTGALKTPTCKPRLNLQKEGTIEETSGLYYNDTWISLQCRNRQFDQHGILKLLQNKTVYFLGDSTLRQWFLYLRDMLGRNVCLTKLEMADWFAREPTNNISLVYAFHGLPVRGRHNTAVKLHYIANRLMVLPGGRNVVICIAIWAHFTANTLEFYHQRLLTIKKGLDRYITKHPTTKVFIKSANTREKGNIIFSNWYAWECDKLMRQVMSSIPGVTIIDVWDMTIGHNSGYRVHPEIEIVRNEVEMMLSFL